MNTLNKLIKTILIPVVLLLIMKGCYSKKTVSTTLLIRHSTNYIYEIELPIHYEGRGNIHTLDLSKYEFDQPHWIYTNSLSGKQEANNIVLTYEREKTTEPWIQSNLRGDIKFKGDSVTINLRIPIYKGNSKTPSHWTAYEFNGSYLTKAVNSKSTKPNITQ